MIRPTGRSPSGLACCTLMPLAFGLTYGCHITLANASLEQWCCCVHQCHECPPPAGSGHQCQESLPPAGNPDYRHTQLRHTLCTSLPHTHLKSIISTRVVRTASYIICTASEDCRQRIKAVPAIVICPQLSTALVTLRVSAVHLASACYSQLSAALVTFS